MATAGSRSDASYDGSLLVYVLVKSTSQPFLANSGSSYGPIMIALNELLCVLTSFSIAARRSPSV